MPFDYKRYLKKNPWIIVNVQNSQARCGRFPTKEAAVKHAETEYRGGDR